MAAPLKLKDFLGRIFLNSTLAASKSEVGENSEVITQVCCIARVLETAGFSIKSSDETYKGRTTHRKLVYYCNEKKPCRRTGPKEIKAVYDAWKKILGTTGAELVFWENFVLGVEIWDEIQPAQESTKIAKKHAREGEMAAFQDGLFCAFLHLWLPVLIQTIQLGVGNRVTLGTVCLRSVENPQEKLLASVHVERLQGDRWLAVSLPLLPDLGILAVAINSQFKLEGSSAYFVASNLKVCSELLRQRLFKIFKKLNQNETLVSVATTADLRCKCSAADLRSGVPSKRRRKAVQQRKYDVPHSIAHAVSPPTGHGSCDDGGSHDEAAAENCAPESGQDVDCDMGDHVSCEDGGSHAEAAVEEAAEKHYIGQHVQEPAHYIGQHGGDERVRRRSSCSPAGLCNVPEVVRTSKMTRGRKRRRNFLRDSIGSSVDNSPCLRGGGQAAVLDSGVLESQQEMDELAAALLESAQCGEDEQAAEEKYKCDAAAALSMSLSEAHVLSECEAQDCEAALSISQSEMDLTLERQAREMALAVRYANRFNREVIETAPNGNCGLSSLLLGLGAEVYLTKDSENRWDCPPLIRAYLVTLLLHLLAALPYELYPASQRLLNSRPPFVDDKGVATGDSLLQFGTRIRKNFMYVDAAFELAYLCYFGFNKELIVVKPVLGETSTQDRVVVHNLMHHHARVIDPEPIYLFYLGGNHFFPFMPVGGLSETVNIAKFIVPRSLVSLTLRQFQIDYEKLERVPGVVKSISEECLCDEVPHSVLVHRALTAGNLNKFFHAREFGIVPASFTKSFPMLYVMHPAVAQGQSSVANEFDVSSVLALAGVPVIEGILQLHVVPEGEGSLPAAFQVFDCDCKGVVAGISADGHAMFLVELLKTDVSHRGGFSRSFVARVKSGLLKALALRLNHGRIVLLSCAEAFVTSLLLLILEEYWGLFPLVTSAVTVGTRKHGMEFVCSNGCIFNECTPRFSRACLLSKELLCPKCIDSEGIAFHDYRNTVSHGNFDLEMKYIFNVRKVVEADEEHCFFSWGDKPSSEAELFDMTTDPRGNAKALRWADVRFGDRERGVSAAVRTDGVVDAFTQLVWCWSFKRRFYLGSKVSIAKDSILFFYGGEMTEHADIVDDCLFEAHVSQKKEEGGAHKVPFMITCTNVRNEASFVACCGVGERANVRTSFVKGRTASGRNFCGVAFVLINNIVANTGLAYRYDKYTFDRSNLAQCLNFEAGCGRIR